MLLYLWGQFCIWYIRAQLKNNCHRLFGRDFSENEFVNSWYQLDVTPALCTIVVSVHMFKRFEDRWFGRDGHQDYQFSELKGKYINGCK